MVVYVVLVQEIGVIGVVLIQYYVIFLTIQFRLDVQKRERIVVRVPIVELPGYFR